MNWIRTNRCSRRKKRELRVVLIQDDCTEAGVRIPRRQFNPVRFSVNTVATQSSSSLQTDLESTTTPINSQRLLADTRAVLHQERKSTEPQLSGPTTWRTAYAACRRCPRTPPTWLTMASNIAYYLPQTKCTGLSPVDRKNELHLMETYGIQKAIVSFRWSRKSFITI